MLIYVSPFYRTVHVHATDAANNLLVSVSLLSRRKLEMGKIGGSYNMDEVYSSPCRVILIHSRLLDESKIFFIRQI